MTKEQYSDWLFAEADAEKKLKRMGYRVHWARNQWHAVSAHQPASVTEDSIQALLAKVTSPTPLGQGVVTDITGIG